jgi:hypothetical protein
LGLICDNVWGPERVIVSKAMDTVGGYRILTTRWLLQLMKSEAVGFPLFLLLHALLLLRRQGNAQAQCDSHLCPDEVSASIYTMLNGR